ncbi:xanthorhodopsin [Nocardioides sp. Soil774]|uniref:bacteriorhodopsin-like n=1 Tax=Nocardioides sp. Soil774 TaxID=1736408 RepID=UPI0006F50C9A|nr:bacteriorhodopsin-like [Nocardioides sp. Soil774]KRE94170.1 xanthorhodopsin [Nocardioides sp. Soil774]
MGLTLSAGQYDLVYNSFSFVIAAMGASLLFFVLVRGSVAPRHRLAITLSTVVVGIALYHYVRIFNSWVDAFTYTGGAYVQDGIPFNEAYRYVDWLLTVPLLLAELVVVLKLDRGKTRSLLVRLTIAALAMIISGYPGELAAADSTAKIVWGVVGTLPFLYIVYVLFVELGNSLGRQAPGVIRLLSGLRWILVVTWTVYPVAYFLPVLVDDPVTAEIARQVGYSVADVLAKPLFGLLVLAIALAKSRDEGYVESGDSGLAGSEPAAPSPLRTRS